MKRKKVIEDIDANLQQCDLITLIAINNAIKNVTRHAHSRFNVLHRIAGGIL